MGKLTTGLILLNTLVFLLVFSMPEDIRGEVIDQYAFSRGTALEPWRWITSLFLHASASHLFFNMLGLFFFGRILEDASSPTMYATVYFGSGILGSLAFLLTSPATAIGASGAIFGIMGTAMLLSPGEMVRIYLIPLPLAVIATLFIIVETLVITFQPAGFAGVATVAHLGGLMAGSALALWYRPKKAATGLLFFLGSLFLIILLAPVFVLIAGIGSLIYSVLDLIIGIGLYTLADLLSFLWVV